LFLILNFEGNKLNLKKKTITQTFSQKQNELTQEQNELINNSRTK